MACWRGSYGNLAGPSPAPSSDPCQASFLQLEDAKRACEHFSWCGGIVKHGGYFCFPAAELHPYHLRGFNEILPHTNTIANWRRTPGCHTPGGQTALPPLAWSAPSVQCGRKAASSSSKADDLLTTNSELSDAIGRWQPPESHGDSSAAGGGAPVTQLSVAIATCCRFHWLQQSVPQYLRNPHVAEVIVTDDCRTDVAALAALAANISLTDEQRSRLILVPNPKRLWPFRNKYSAVERARPGAWIALLDSDNFASLDTYFAPLVEHWRASYQQRPPAHLMFSPSNFYRQAAANGSRISTQLWKSAAFRRHDGLRNGGNHVFQRESALRAWRHLAETDDQAGRDGRESILINTLLYDHGGEMEVVAGMTYIHRITTDSFFASKDANERRKAAEGHNGAAPAVSSSPSATRGAGASHVAPHHGGSSAGGGVAHHGATARIDGGSGGSHHGRGMIDSELPGAHQPPLGWSVEGLDALMRAEHSDKSTAGHGYVHAYAPLLGPWRNDVRCVVEIGIGAVNQAKRDGSPMYANMGTWEKSSRGKGYKPGASLRAWAAYFPSARVLGVDIDAEVVDAVNEAKLPRVSALAADTQQLDAFRSKLDSSVPRGSCDIIVDDGLHTWEGQQKTLLALWPYLRRGGYYFVEDVFWTWTYAATHDVTASVSAALSSRVRLLLSLLCAVPSLARRGKPPSRTREAL